MKFFIADASICIITDCSEKLCFCMFPYGKYFIRIGNHTENIMLVRKDTETLYFLHGKYDFHTERNMFSVRKKVIFPYGKVIFPYGNITFSVRKNHFSVRNKSFFHQMSKSQLLFSKFAFTILILRLIAISTRNL